MNADAALQYVEPRWRELGLQGSCETWLTRCGLPLAGALRRGGVQLVGVAGAQGTGKSTASALLVPLLVAHGVSAVVLSLDDFYLPKTARARLARDIHPLLATRGVPGTHDVALLHACLRAARAGCSLELPRFSKGLDDRLPELRREQGPFDVVMLEGWCVGARPQEDSDLVEPCNALEAREDPEGKWRRYVNAQLTAAYAEVFAELSMLIFFAAPGMESVLSFRREQEAHLRSAGRGMSDAELERFIAHFERITRWMLRELPTRADVVVTMDAARQVRDVLQR